MFGHTPPPVLKTHAVSTDTGNACKHPGYDEFNPPSWPSTCAPNKEDWITTERRVCGLEGSYPEEFWQCSDIAITEGEYNA